MADKKSKHNKKTNAKKAKNTKGNAPEHFSFKDFFNLTKGETTRFIIGLTLICIAFFLFISFTWFIIEGKKSEEAINILASGNELSMIPNAGGILGLISANYFIQDGFGFASYFIPLFMIMLSMILMKTHHFKIMQQFINCSFLMIWLSVTLASIFPDGLDVFNPGGQHGINVSKYLVDTIGEIGRLLVLAITMAMFCIYLTRKTIELIRKLMHVEKPINNIAERMKGMRIIGAGEDVKDATVEPYYITSTDDEGPIVEDVAKPANYLDEEQPTVIDLGTSTIAEKNEPYFTPQDEPQNPNNDTTSENQDAIELTITETGEEEEADGEVFGDLGSLDTPYDPKLDFEHYKYPSIDLLKKYPDSDSTIDMEEQQANKDKIINVLRNFGVEISSIKATVGPTITLYEITPAKGVRIAKIRNLEDDIALSLSAIGIRIIAPIPGKGTIGIEVPNAKPKIVSMESVINSRKFQECDYELPIALGRTITNEIYIQDLAKMPHLLVAGATGQGKSVGLNAIISSLLFKKHPTELKLVLVDPKKVEFSVYAPLENNFMAEIAESESDPVITDVEKVKHTLKSLCQEMDDRYMLLKSAHCRNIKEYNEKFKARRLNPEKGHHFLPYIVVIIDEYGDLIMVAGKEIEHPITRIAQLARAVGIHMVIATQRPTATIITGNIKANFPARMAFRVMASVDSRTILDQMGANQLVGRGDMLFLAAGKQAERVQCAFIDTPEVEALNTFICDQQSPLRAYELPEVAIADEDYGDMGDGDGKVERYDSMFVDVARYVVNGQQGSTSAIQRTFAIGYNRAGRLMDQLEKAKIVGPGRGSKPREVLIIDESDLNVKLDALHLL